jgi:hypothetical protein
MIEVRNEEIIPLYLLLRCGAGDTDERLAALLRRLEHRLYDSLSIEEMEMLDSASGAAIAVLTEKLSRS